MSAERSEERAASLESTAQALAADPRAEAARLREEQGQERADA